MAQVRAFAAIAFDDIDFYFYQSGYDGDEILQEENKTWSEGGYTTPVYTDFFYGYALSDSDESWALGAAGANLFYEGYPSGTANALSEWNRDDTGTWTMRWIIDRVSFSLSDVIEAVITPTVADDLMLLNAMLSGDDKIILSAFDDRFSGFGGNDSIEGGGGADVIYGDRGSDSLYGDQGSDDLYGSGGNDRLFGGNGNDYLDGSSGNDMLEGGRGIDQQWGSSGNDVFFYRNTKSAPLTGTEYDTIGFLTSGSDKISLSSIDANTAESAPGDQSFSFVGTAAFDGKAGRLRYDVIDADNDGDADDILVLGTVNADATADFGIAVLNRTSIESADFIL